MLAVPTAAALLLSMAAVDLPKAVRVDPGGATLPANALRLYVWFDRPARLLVDARDVRLLDAGGAAIRGAFMDFGQALWSPDGRRLTLLFDPGRVKRDVEGAGDSVAPLVAGRTFQIAVGDLRWRFAVAPAIRDPLEPSRWVIAAPKAATRKPVAIHFGRTMDAALLVSRLSVIGPEGVTVRGRAVAETGAAAWHFVPAAPWRAGIYRIAIDATLEDVAGNRIGEALDHAVGAPAGNGGDAWLSFRVGRSPTPLVSPAPPASKADAATSSARAGPAWAFSSPPAVSGRRDHDRPHRHRQTLL